MYTGKGVPCSFLAANGHGWPFSLAIHEAIDGISLLSASWVLILACTPANHQHPLCSRPGPVWAWSSKA